MFVPAKFNFKNEELISGLEQKITSLETELQQLENKLNRFQLEIQIALHQQLKRIRELTDLYKSQKVDKKQKRSAQKKRGKNYKDPIGIVVSKSNFSSGNSVSNNDQQELKRLFKEAIVQIHPDKFTDADEDLNERATAITARLNSVYQSGNLDDLNWLHEHIINGNALNYVPDQPSTAKNPEALILFLRQQILKLKALIASTKASAIYELFSSNDNIAVIISDLKTQFENRILILEKRIK